MKKRLTLLLIIVLVLTSCAGCKKPVAETGPTNVKKDLVVTSYTDPENLNPYALDNLNATRLYLQCYETLINAGPDGEFIPMLAERWEIADDNLSITFYLRKGVQFHNGYGEMKASDVIFSFKTMAKFPIPKASTEWMLFEQAEALDDYTVKLPFSEVCSLALVQLSIVNRGIVSEKGWKEVGLDGLLTKDVGTGPFYITDYLLKDHATFTRFDDYWGEKAILETVKFRFIPESSQAAVELETGGVDLIMDVAAIDYDRIDKSSTMSLVFDASSLVDMIHFNNTDKIFSDVRVRQAMAYAINREDIFKAVYMGWGRVPYGPIAPEVWAYNDEFEGNNYPYKYDIEKAKKLLADAGYPNGFTFELNVDQDVNRQATSQILKNQFEKIGVTANINNMEQATLNQKIAESTAQSWLYAVNAVTLEPDRALQLRFHKNNAVLAGSNHTYYNNDTFSALLDDARATYDASVKKEKYLEAQRIWMSEVPSVPYYVRPQVYACVNNLKGVVYYGNGYLFNKAYFE